MTKLLKAGCKTRFEILAGGHEGNRLRSAGRACNRRPAAAVFWRDDFMLRIRRVGICGTDLRIVQGRQPSQSFSQLIGYEFSGVMEEGDSPSLDEQVTIVSYVACLLGAWRRVGLSGLVQGDVAFSDPEFHKLQATLLATRNAALEAFATVLTAMRAGSIRTAAPNTHRAALATASDRFPAWLALDGGIIKAILKV